MLLGKILAPVMRFCYYIIQSYGWAIILFTLFSKIVLLPVSVWVQKNSIKMVKMQPDINRIKIKHFGDPDAVADEQQAIFKREKYNPFASLIPLAVQLALLMGLVDVIGHPISYILEVPAETVSAMTADILAAGSYLEPESSSLEIAVVRDIRSGGDNKYIGVDNGIIADISAFNMDFLGLDLGWIAASDKGISFIVPFLAGLSALILCLCQNRLNVLQAEQSKAGQYGTMAFSVGLSLYLGFFVPAGVALYWVASNIMAIIQQILLNLALNPREYVNYEELEQTGRELRELQSRGRKSKLPPAVVRRAKEDYKKFFKVVGKHLVFYSESGGFYKYFKGYIEYILKHTNITIHYITSDINDGIFKTAEDNPQIKPYFIDEQRLIILMMKMDADVVVMTMPDIETYHIKRSYVRKDIEYIYIPHSMCSYNLTTRKGFLDHYDTLFNSGPHQLDEALKTEEVYGIPKRKMINCGYCLLDEMTADYESREHPENKRMQILIAPSWQKDNIIDLCLEEMLDSIKDKDYDITLRPHPQHVRHAPEKFEELRERYNENKNILIQTDFSSNETVFNADILITDWSGISFEYAFATKKPVIYIDTPMKIMNPEYERLGIEPFNIWIRREIGEVVGLSELDTLPDVIDRTILHKEDYRSKITELTEKWVYNPGSSSRTGGKYIIKAVKEHIKARKENES